MHQSMHLALLKGGQGLCQEKCIFLTHGHTLDSAPRRCLQLHLCRCSEIQYYSLTQQDAARLWDNITITWSFQISEFPFSSGPRFPQMLLQFYQSSRFRWGSWKEQTRRCVCHQKDGSIYVLAVYSSSLAHSFTHSLIRSLTRYRVIPYCHQEQK